MLSQVKRKQKLLLALTLTVFIVGSILAFSIQEAYSAKNFNSSKSNTSTAISQVRTDLLELKSNFGVYLEGNNVESYIDNTIMLVDKVEMGVNEMSEFFFVMSVELESLKQTAESTASEATAESTASEATADPSGEVGEIEWTIPEWIKNNAGWWADGLISEDDYVTGLKWMINNGVIQIDLEKELEEATIAIPNLIEARKGAN